MARPPLESGARRRKARTLTWLPTLLLDCFENDCDEFVVISNDSDFAEPVRTVKDRFHRCIGVVNPNHRTRSISLQNAASWTYSYIPRRLFRDNQLSPQLADANGVFQKPAAW